MASTVMELYHFLDENYPFDTQMSFDNAGFLVGDGDSPVQAVLVALDITTQVIQEAIDNHCQLIFTHHPIIFSPLKSLVTHKPTEKMIIQLIQNNIAVISAHTNLDRGREGVNYHLAQRLQLKNSTFLLEEGQDRNGNTYGLGYKGTVHKENLSATDYARFVAEALSCKGLRFADVGKPVSSVAVGGGACGSCLADVAKLGCDTFITGDVKYDIFLEAKERGINLIDAGHYATEQVICQPVAEKLQNAFPTLTVSVSQSHEEVSQSL